eukprot:1067038-Prorocentrum_minimum.AAC.1
MMTLMMTTSPLVVWRVARRSARGGWCTGCRCWRRCRPGAGGCSCFRTSPRTRGSRVWTCLSCCYEGSCTESDLKLIV